MPTRTATLATRTHVVRSDDADNRDWLRDQPVCRELGQHHISHVEILKASEPFSMTRTDQSGTCMMACFGGSGMVMADGHWKRLDAGQACLLRHLSQIASRPPAGSR